MRDYDSYYAFDTEGGRIGIQACLRCGAAVIVGNKDVDVHKIHDDWHDSLSPTKKEEK